MLIKGNVNCTECNSDITWAYHVASSIHSPVVVTIKDHYAMASIRREDDSTVTFHFHCKRCDKVNEAVIQKSDYDITRY